MSQNYIENGFFKQKVETVPRFLLLLMMYDLICFNQLIVIVARIAKSIGFHLIVVQSLKGRFTTLYFNVNKKDVY